MSDLQPSADTRKENVLGEIDLKDHLAQNGFIEFGKIESAVNNGEITIKDLIECNQTDLQDICQKYGIKSIQKNRFINAIKKLVNSDSSHSTNNTESSIVDIMINNMEILINDRIKSLTNLKDENKKCIQSGKTRINGVFNQLRSYLDTLEKESIQQVCKYI